MSKERLGHKHVICTNIQPPLGSHWPCRGRRLLLGPPQPQPQAYSLGPGLQGGGLTAQKGKLAVDVPRGAVRKGWVRRGPHQSQAAEGRPTIPMSRRVFWDGLHFRSVEDPSSPALTAPLSSRKAATFGKDLASWIFTGIPTQYPPNTTLRSLQSVFFCRVS